MTKEEIKLSGMVPDHLRVRSARILLDSLAVDTDVGFHDFEVGSPQRLLVTVEIWLDHEDLPPGDDPAGAWDYDLVRTEVRRIATAQRYNLQETLAHAIFARLASLRGVRDLRLRLSKPDVYPEADGVGVEIASFRGQWPSGQ